MSINSTISGVPNRVYNNALKAYLRDPRRSIRLLDFFTLREREILLFTALGDIAYDSFLNWDDYHV